MKILVFGANGSQQFNVIGEAKKKGAEVIATTSSPEGFKKLSEAGATPVLADIGDAAKMLEITQGIDAIAYVIPASLPDLFDGLEFSKNVIDAAKANNVGKFVWNTSGWLESEKIGSPMDDIKLDVKQYLIDSGLDYVIIEPTIYMENMMGAFCAPFISNERILSYPTPEAMPIGWIASRDVSALVVGAIYNTELKADSFKVSGMQNLRGNELALEVSRGLGEDIVYYAQKPKVVGDILRPFLGDAGASGVEAYYEHLQNATEYPQKFNADMSEILEKLQVKMTSVAEWAHQNKANFIK